MARAAPVDGSATPANRAFSLVPADNFAVAQCDPDALTARLRIKRPAVHRCDEHSNSFAAKC
jgi:hypothetical protein